MKKIVFILSFMAFLPFLLRGQNKQLTFREGATSGVVTESQLVTSWTNIREKPENILSSKCLTNFSYKYRDASKTFFMMFVGDSYVEAPYRMAAKMRTLAQFDRGLDAGPGYGCFGATPPSGIWFSQNNVTAVSRSGFSMSSKAGKACILNATGSYYRLIKYYPSAYTEDLGTFTSIKFWTYNEPSGGIFDVKVDGTVVQTINTALGTGRSGYTISGLTNSTHTIEFISTSGSIKMLDYIIERSGKTSVWNFGSGGSTVLNWRSLMDGDWDDLTSYSPDMININLGTNDKYAYSVADFRAHYLLFLQTVRAKFPLADICLHGIAKTAETTPLFEGSYLDYNNVIKQICVDSCYQFVDIDQIFPDWGKATNLGLTEDLLHPSKDGGDRISETVYLTLKNGSNLSNIQPSTLNYLTKSTATGITASRIFDDNTNINVSSNFMKLDGTAPLLKINGTTGSGARGISFENNGTQFGYMLYNPGNNNFDLNASNNDNFGLYNIRIGGVRRIGIDSINLKLDGNILSQKRSIEFQNNGATYARMGFTPLTAVWQFDAGLSGGFGGNYVFNADNVNVLNINSSGASFTLPVSGVSPTTSAHFTTRGYSDAVYARLNSDNVFTGKIRINQNISGGFGAIVTTGTLDFNDVSNITAGGGNTLLRANAANSMGNVGGTNFFHPLNFEFGSIKDGSGNVTTLYIPYSDASSQRNSLWMRGRFNGTFDSYYNFPTIRQDSLINGYLPVYRSSILGWGMVNSLNLARIDAVNNFTQNNTFSRTAIGGAIDNSYMLNVVGNGKYSTSLDVGTSITAALLNLTGLANSTTNTEVLSISSNVVKKQEVKDLEIGTYQPVTLSSLTADVGGGVLKHILTLDCGGYYQKTFKVNMTNNSATAGTQITFTNMKAGGQYTVIYYNNSVRDLLYDSSAKLEDGSTNFSVISQSGAFTHHFRGISTSAVIKSF